jgi:transcriptional regulator with XRE-family HTH domain
MSASLVRFILPIDTRQSYLHGAVRQIEQEKRVSIGEKLFSLRQKSGESLQGVADKVGVSKAHVWELEKGRSKNPSFEMVRKLAAHYGVSIDVLTGNAAEPEAADLQVDRIHRGLEELSDRDREIVEQMIAAMKQKAPGAS